MRTFLSLLTSIYVEIVKIIYIVTRITSYTYTLSSSDPNVNVLEEYKRRNTPDKTKQITNNEVKEIKKTKEVHPSTPINTEGKDVITKAPFLKDRPPTYYLDDFKLIIETDRFILWDLHIFK